MIKSLSSKSNCPNVNVYIGTHALKKINDNNQNVFIFRGIFKLKRKIYILLKNLCM